MRLNKIAGRFSPPPSSSLLLLLLQRVEINLLNYCTINPFFTAKDVIISFRACSCIIDYFILLSRCAEVQYFVFPTGVYAEVGFNGVHRAPECNCRHHLGAVSNTSHAYSNCKHFPCSIFFCFWRWMYTFCLCCPQAADRQWENGSSSNLWSIETALAVPIRWFGTSLQSQRTMKIG